MPFFKIISNTSDITLSNKWVPSTKFNSKDRLVDEAGHEIGSEYKGRQYRIIEKREYTFSGLEHFGRGFLGVVAVICTLCLGLLSKSVRNLFTNSKETIRFGVRRYYNKLRYEKSSEKFIERALRNLSAFSFEKREFLKICECVCDWYSPVEISDRALIKKMAVKLADYLPNDKGHVTILPTPLYFLMSPESRLGLTKEDKIELLLLYAEKNPGMISYHLHGFRAGLGIELEDVLKLSKKCVARDPRTLFYINFSSGLDVSQLEQIQEENNIRDEDLNRIKKEALDLYVKDGELMLESDGRPFILGQP